MESSPAFPRHFTYCVGPSIFDLTFLAVPFSQSPAQNTRTGLNLSLPVPLDDSSLIAGVTGGDCRHGVASLYEGCSQLVGRRPKRAGVAENPDALDVVLYAASPQHLHLRRAGRCLKIGLQLVAAINDMPGGGIVGREVVEGREVCALDAELPRAKCLLHAAQEISMLGIIGGWHFHVLRAYPSLSLNECCIPQNARICTVASPWEQIETNARGTHLVRISQRSADSLEDVVMVIRPAVPPHHQLALGRLLRTADA